MNSPIKWTKTFSVSHENGSFRVFLSEHEGKHYYASILYFEPKKFFNLGDKGGLDFKHESFDGNTEKVALQKLKDWINKKLPGKHTFQAV